MYKTNWKWLAEKKEKLSKNSTKTKSFVLNFYEMIVDDAEGRINYHLMEILRWESNSVLSRNMT